MEKQMKAWIQTIRQLFSPEELTRLARKTGFIRRQRSLTAEAFLTLCAWGCFKLGCIGIKRKTLKSPESMTEVYQKCWETQSCRDFDSISNVHLLGEEPRVQYFVD